MSKVCYMTCHACYAVMTMDGVLYFADGNFTSDLQNPNSTVYAAYIQELCLNVRFDIIKNNYCSSIIFLENLQTYLAAPLAFLGFHKRGKYSLVTSAHTSFPIFLLCQKQLLLKRGTMADLAKG